MTANVGPDRCAGNELATALNAANFLPHVFSELKELLHLVFSAIKPNGFSPPSRRPFCLLFHCGKTPAFAQNIGRLGRYAYCKSVQTVIIGQSPLRGSRG
jgi:hypothetical protein